MYQILGLILRTGWSCSGLIHGELLSCTAIDIVCFVVAHGRSSLSKTLKEKWIEGYEQREMGGRSGRRTWRENSGWDIKLID